MLTNTLKVLVNNSIKKPTRSADQQFKFTLGVRQINSDIKEEKVGKL